MANISYGRSVKPVMKDNARTRRHRRRMVEAIECRRIEVILAAELGWEPPARNAELSRAENHCRRVFTDRISKAVETETEYHKQILAGASRYNLGDVDRGICLSGVAFYRAGHRRVRKDATHIVG
ncbi:transcriptional antitermination N peptide [Pantoea dispersa]